MNRDIQTYIYMTWATVYKYPMQFSEKRRIQTRIRLARKLGMRNNWGLIEECEEYEEHRFIYNDKFLVPFTSYLIKGEWCD